MPQCQLVKVEYTCGEPHTRLGNAPSSMIPSQNKNAMSTQSPLLLSLEVVKQDAALLAVGTPVLDNDARAVDDLAGVTLSVENAKTGPFAQLLAIGNLDEGDLVLGAQGDDELLVGFFLAGLVEDAHVCLAAVEGLRRLTETAGETIVHQSQLQNTLEGVQNGHLTLGGGISRNLNLLGDLDVVVIFYVRLRYGLAGCVRWAVSLSASCCCHAAGALRLEMKDEETGD
jgi:hypothetical protein